MSCKVVQVIKTRVNTVRYRDAKGKWHNCSVAATSGAGGLLTLHVPHTNQILTSKGKLTSMHGTDGYDNRQ